MKLPVRLFSLISTAALLGSSPARAQQQFSWNNYCTVGSLQFCASVELTLAPDNSGGTSFSIRMRNLQGTLGSTPWHMTNTSMNNLFSDSHYVGSGIHPPLATLYGSAGFHVDMDPVTCANLNLEPCPSANWRGSEWIALGPDYWNGTNGPRGFVGWTGGNNPRPTDIIGCDAPAAPLYSNWGSFQTCGDGWVGFAFSLPGNWTFDGSSQMSWYGLSDQGGTLCTVDVNCFEVQVTPEPVSIVLLGTGLLGVGALKRRKRRADHHT